MKIPTNASAHFEPDEKGSAIIDANMATETVMFDYYGVNLGRSCSNITPEQALAIAAALKDAAERVIAARKTTMTVEVPTDCAFSAKLVIEDLGGRVLD